MKKGSLEIQRKGETSSLKFLFSFFLSSYIHICLSLLTVTLRKDLNRHGAIFLGSFVTVRTCSPIVLPRPPEQSLSSKERPTYLMRCLLTSVLDFWMRVSTRTGGVAGLLRETQPVWCLVLYTIVQNNNNKFFI